MDTNQPLYPIREVSRLTGVNSITLRAWERRYGLIEPVRTESGHRLYTDEHIQQIQTAVSLTQQGIPISRVKSLLDQPNPGEVAKPASKTPDSSGGSPPNHALESSYQFLLDPLMDLNLGTFETALDQLFVDFPEHQAYFRLAQVNLLYTEWPKPQQLIWKTLLGMRLQTRLRHQLRALPQYRAHKVLIVDASREINSVTQDFLRLYYAKKGFLAIVTEFESFDQDATSMAELVKTFEIETCVLLSTQPLPESLQWQKWSQRFSALEMHIWWQQAEPTELVRLVQNRGFNLETMFTGR